MLLVFSLLALEVVWVPDEVLSVPVPGSDAAGVDAGALSAVVGSSAMVSIPFRSRGRDLDTADGRGRLPDNDGGIGPDAELHGFRARDLLVTESQDRALK